MPVTIKEVVNTTVTKINSAKIQNINIDVDNKKIVFIIAFGILTDQNFKRIKSKTVIYSGEKFMEIAVSGVVAAHNIYENISTIGYAFLERDGHLDFKF